MAVDSPIYFYLDELLSNTWVQLSDKLLNRSHRSELTTATGFQDALAEIFEREANAHDRTRAKELYILGLLSGPLVNPKDGGTSRSHVPLGWHTLQSDGGVHTRLGYCAYAIGKSLSRNVASDAINKGLSVIAAICLFQCGVELPARKWVTFASVFRHICFSFPRPSSIEPVSWERWLAHGMIATLNDTERGPVLIDNVFSKSLVGELLIPRSGSSPLEASATELKTHIENNGSFVGSSREKASLFWIGTGNSPRGIYSLAQIAASDLVEAVCSIEIESLFSGKDSPLAKLSQREPSNLTQCVLYQLREILSPYTHARFAMENCMKKLSEGVAESLAFLRAQELPSPSHSKVYYAHGTEGNVSDGIDQELVIPKEKCISTPSIGDFVHYGPHQLKIKNVIDAGVDWRIVVC